MKFGLVLTRKPVQDDEPVPVSGRNLTLVVVNTRNPGDPDLVLGTFTYPRPVSASAPVTAVSLTPTSQLAAVTRNQTSVSEVWMTSP